MEKIPRVVRAHWTGPHTVGTISERIGSGDSEYGLYQVYGHHVVFGPGALLYVGIARDQTFGMRFSQHASWLNYEQGLAVHLGLIEPDDYADDEPPDWPKWKRLLGDIEALTVYHHSPPYNCKHIISYAGQRLHIQNWGDRGRLLPEYSSDWPPTRRPDQDDDE